MKFIGRVPLLPVRVPLLLIAVLFLGLVTNARAQDIVVDVPVPTPTETAEPAIPQAIPVAKIADAFAELRVSKQQIEDCLNATQVEHKINDGYNELKTKLDTFAEEHQALLEANTPADVWFTRSLSLDAFQKTNDALSESLQTRAKELAEMGTSLDFIHSEWQLTAQSLRQTKQSASVVADIGKVLEKTAYYQKQIKQRQSNVLNMQHLLDAQDERLAQLHEQLNAVVAQKQDRLLTRNSAVLWHCLTPDILQATWEAWLLSLAKQVDDLEVFWAKNSFALSIYLLIFGVVVLVMRGIHRVIKPWETRSETLRQVVSLTELPIPVAALLSTVCFLQGGGTALHITGVIAGLFAVIPALVVMRRIISDHYTPLLGAILAAYGIELLCYLSYETVLVVRLCGLAEALLLVFLLFPCMRPALYRQMPEDKRLKVCGRMRFGCKLAITLMGIAVCANVVGYVDLSASIVTTVVMTAVRTVLALAAAHFTLALVLFAITVPPLKHLNVISANRELILVQAKSLLYGLVVLAALASVSDLTGHQGAAWQMLKKLWCVHFTCGNVDFLLGNLILAIFILWLSRPISMVLVALMRQDVLPRLKWQANSAQMVVFFAHYVPYILAVLIACAIIGLSLDNLAMVASALTLGISFGLQDIFKNFVSGLILLFEPRIVVGGTVEFGNICGTLVQVGMRASVVRLFDGRDVIVPNSEFISNKVVSVTDSKNVPYRFAIVFSVLGAVDPDKVREVAEKCAAEEPNVVEQPAPVLLMSNIKEGYPEFTLQAWAKNYGVQTGTQNNLTYSLTKALRAQGWELAGVKSEIVSLEPQSQAAKRYEAVSVEKAEVAATGQDGDSAK